MKTVGTRRRRGWMVAARRKREERKAGRKRYREDTREILTRRRGEVS